MSVRGQRVPAGFVTPDELLAEIALQLQAGQQAAAWHGSPPRPAAKAHLRDMLAVAQELAAVSARGQLSGVEPPACRPSADIAADLRHELSTGDVAAKLHLSARQVRRKAERGELGARREARDWRFPLSAVEAAQSRRNRWAGDAA